MAQRNEDEVFAEYQAAEGEARTALYAELAEAIAHHIERVIGQTLHREDPEILSQVLVRLLEALPSFEGKSKFSTWVQASTYNACIDWLRKYSREVSLEEVDELEAPDLEAALFPRLQLEEIMHGLDEEDQILLNAKIEGQEVEELHERFGLTKDGVHKRWERLQEHLLGLLQQSATR